MSQILKVPCPCGNEVTCFIGQAWTVCGCGRAYDLTGKEVPSCPPNPTISGAGDFEAKFVPLVGFDKTGYFVHEHGEGFPIFHGNGEREHDPPQSMTESDAKPYTHGEHRGHMVERRGPVKHGNVLLYCVCCRKTFSGAEKHIRKEPGRDPNSYIR